MKNSFFSMLLIYVGCIHIYVCTLNVSRFAFEMPFQYFIYKLELESNLNL